MQESQFVTLSQIIRFCGTSGWSSPIKVSVDNNLFVQFDAITCFGLYCLNWSLDVSITYEVQVVVIFNDIQVTVPPKTTHSGFRWRYVSECFALLKKFREKIDTTFHASKPW